MEEVLWGTTDERETQPPLTPGGEIRYRAGPLQGQSFHGPVGPWLGEVRGRASPLAR